MLGRIAAGLGLALALAGTADAEAARRWGFSLVAAQGPAAEGRYEHRLYHSPIYDLGWVDGPDAMVRANGRFCAALDEKLGAGPERGAYGCRGGYWFQAFETEAQARAAMWDQIMAWRKRSGSGRMFEVAAFNPVVPAPVEARPLAPLAAAAPPRVVVREGVSYVLSERAAEPPAVIYPPRYVDEPEAWAHDPQMPQTAALNQQVVAQSRAIDARNDAALAGHMAAQAAWQAEVAARSALTVQAQQRYAEEVAAWERRVADCRAGIREACGP